MTFNLMPSRLLELQQTLLGYHQTHVLLVARDATGGLIAGGQGNDLGLYLVVTKIASWWSLSPLKAVTMVLATVMILGLMSGLVAVTRLWRRSSAFWWAVISLVLLSALSWKVGDVYITATAVVIGVVPWLIGWLRPSWRYSNISLIGAATIGLVLGLANTFRAESGTTVLVFAAVVLFLMAIRWTDKAKLAATLIVAFLIPGLLVGHAVSVRDRYLTNHQPHYVAPIDAHPFWHTAYIGFGYLNNDFGLAYRDEVGINAVKAVDPTVVFLSPRYEQILRQQTLSLIRQRPLFALETIFAKLGVLLLLYLPLFGNFGLWRAWQNRLGGRRFYPFYLAMAFSLLSGVLAIPELRYVTGYVSLALLYGLTVLNERVISSTGSGSTTKRAGR